MNTDLESLLNEVVARLPCFEPAGHEVELAARDLLGHLLVVGATGSGKSSSVINPLLDQLIRHCSDDPIRRNGLLILDLKGDGEVVPVVRKALGGEQDRLTVLDGRSRSWIDPFEPIRQFELKGIDASAQRLASGVPVVESNPYWHQVFGEMVRQVLNTLFLSDPEFTVDEGISLLSKQLLGGDAAQEMYDRLSTIEVRCFAEKSESLTEVLQNLRRTQRMWETLDPRTKSNFLSMGPTIVGPLSSAVTRPLFSGEESDRISVGEVINNGEILLVSMDSFSNPEAAAFVGRMVKADFYAAISARESLVLRPQRLAGFIVDEWAQCATGGIGQRSSDTAALQLIRSRGGFVIGATQSIASIDLRLGFAQRNATLANFNNIVMMRTREEAAEALASRWFGRKKVRLQVPGLSFGESPFGGIGFLPRPRWSEVEVPVVSDGDLARLHTGQAYVAVGSRIHPDPVWMVPLHEQPHR